MSSKLVLVIFSTAMLLQLSAAEVEFPGKLVNSPYSIAPLKDFIQECDATGVYTACQSCKSVLVCMSGISETRDCPADKPYCNNNDCSTTLSSEYECTPDPLKCTGVGFYPDPKQCQFYHYCEAADEESSVYDCQPNNVFNPVTNMCKQKRLAADCVTVKCDSNKLLQSYGTSKTYFAYCTGNDADEIKMLKCETNYSFTGTGCLFTCPKVGKFPHPDPAKYNECYLSGIKLVSKEMKCPLNKEFNAEKQVCLTPQ